jgi:hypothetical protein
MLKVLRGKFERLSERDNLFVYYAGHGQFDPTKKQGFWIPVDGELSEESTWIPLSTITHYLSADSVRAKNIIVVTDSCYGGALVRGGPTPGHDVSPKREIGIAQLAQYASKRSRQVLASGGYEVVPDQSEFATLFRQALSGNTRRAVDLEYLFFTQIYPALHNNGDQIPELGRVKSGPDDDGQFVLLRSRVTSSEPIVIAATVQNGCIANFLPRAALPGDNVCVDSDTRVKTLQENREAASHREPGGGPYGPDTCRQGFVWREAGPQDHVCVTPDRRRQANYDNAVGVYRRAP